MTPHATADETSLSSLVSGIAQDAQKLLRQQLTLFQVEVKHDLTRTKNAALPLALGLVVCLAAFILLGVTLGLVLEEFLLLRTWAAFALVTGAYLFIGAFMVIWGNRKLASFNPLPDETVEGLKETIQWKTKT